MAVSEDVRRAVVITVILFINEKNKWGFGVFFCQCFIEIYGF